MSEQLPPVQQPRRIELTADELPPASSAAVPTAAPPPLPVVKQPVASPNATAFCHACGNALDPRAVMCPRCGVAQQQMLSATHTMAALTLNRKSNGMAILLSLFFVGAGQWYVGRVGRGFAFFAAYFLAWVMVLAIIGLLLVPAVAIWAAIDANKLANEHNARLLTQTTGIVSG